LVDGTYISCNIGDFTIFGRYLDVTGSANLTVIGPLRHHGDTVSLIIEAPPSIIIAGNRQNFTATGYDSMGRSWDVSLEVNWSISGGAGGSWTDNTYTSASTGNWTVTATLGDLQALTSVQVVDSAGYPSVTVTQSGARLSSLKIADRTPFKVDLGIDNATDVYGFNMFIEWNPAVLELTEVTEGSFLSQIGQTLCFVNVDPNNIGYIPMGISCVLFVDDGADGSGVLATLTFQTIGIGDSNITIDYGSKIAVNRTINDDGLPDIPRYVPFACRSAAVTVLSADNISPIDYIHDGQVNFDDLLYFAGAYVNYQQNLRFDSSCDLNHDGLMNFDDLLQFSDGWQTAYT
jgi:hypothetical protein